MTDSDFASSITSAGEPLLSGAYIRADTAILGACPHLRATLAARMGLP